MVLIRYIPDILYVTPQLVFSVEIHAELDVQRCHADLRDHGSTGSCLVHRDVTPVLRFPESGAERTLKSSRLELLKIAHTFPKTGW
ncbi:hypothetical protein RvY_18432 [Ramazzottius varieornatus]|uniref:Uncharacterized protein n=1 Tax=Ramazzottius varieornatus TaxID=947166 RepID=A0A1D1WB83_RAMVA|nr:hypothetical protein RvY_18432 [Ramazzottius varieornatus]